MTTGVLCAVPHELGSFVELMPDATQTTVAQWTFTGGHIDGHHVVLTESGMGKVNAATATTLLVDKFGCDAVIFTGVAGGLDPDLEIGDIVIADRIVANDSGIIENEQLSLYQPGHVRFFNPTDELGFDVDGELLARVRHRLSAVLLPILDAEAGGQDRPPRITYGTILSGDAYLHCAATRQRWHQEFGGSAVEMEGAAVAQVCTALGVPWLVIRALSDLAGHDPDIDFTLYTTQVAHAAVHIVHSLLPVI
ncbi:5'-methylthioadenosine/adenosylhomocysteine nucleosidase [Mycolicibacterium sp. 120266]|jgi:adenosylhomocysteine nucleosidase|uniref:5'-methylthioadenosine/adenosylhomocysteine nucleosidase n=1 Tax=Mycolicibacterium sp. 120266 TaxID=3090601 RepID=UPI00299EDB66|nr:5'-methylthioadenosine/adenosylhomocysteine nucleosidase [Mycolicibacterium sp. 120266]MDX1871809.1 5'-methylthioadenosine/adenosylhomocysteine nucleosidase [Mycolicibacterium sp. 120266]